MGARISKINFFGPFTTKDARADREAVKVTARASDTFPPAVAARVPKMPAEIWGSIFRHVPLSPEGSKSIGDLKALRLTCRTFQAETLHAHQKLTNRIASGAAQSFLRGARDFLTPEEVDLLGRARALTLRGLEVSGSILSRLNFIFTHSPRLTFLDLAGCRIGNVGARDLAIGQLQSLQTLDLRHNQIGAAGARDLAIGQLQSLQTLELGWNEIGDAGASDLRRRLQRAQLYRKAIAAPLGPRPLG